MKISIVTPSFQQIDWLRLCVASVRDNVDDSKSIAVEHIIQDGGSENIEDFAREIGADFYRDGGLVFSGLFLNPNYRIAVYSEKDCGMYDALNHGFSRVSGDVLAWLNSDEQYLLGTLAKVSHYFKRDGRLDVLLGDALLTDENHKPICYRRIMVPSRWHTRLAHLHSLSCAMFFRKDALPQPPFNSKWKVIGDVILMDYFLGEKKKILACRELLSVYSFTGANLSMAVTTEKEIWLTDKKFVTAILKLYFVFLHRLRRSIDGSYLRFYADVAFFTLKSPNRIRWAGRISGVWPSKK